MYDIPGFAYSHISDDQDQGRVLAVRRFRAVTVLAAGVTEVDAADTNPIDGVAQMDGPNLAPETIRVMKDGITKAIAGAAVVAGTLVATDAEGRFVTTAVPADAVGRALTAAGAADEQISVLLY